MNHAELWATLIDLHLKAFERNGSKRCPITVVANTRTLNTFIVGETQAEYLMFDKIILKTSLGDIHFLRHKQQADGELMVL